nr:hypothetical protein [Tanacetum cinerariifolium]
MTLLNNLMKTFATLTQKVAHLEQDKVAQALEITKLKQRVKKLERKKRSKHSSLKRLRKVDANKDVTLVNVDTIVKMDDDIQWRMEEDVTAVKEINVAEPEPTVFNNKEVTMTMAQTLIKLKAKKSIILDEQMVKRLQDEEIEQVNLKRKPIFIAQAKKNMIVYLKNMGGYKIAHFKGMTYDQEMFEEDLKNMLQIIPVADFKVEALQVKYPFIDWEIYSEGSRTYLKIIRVGRIIQAYRSFEDMFKEFDREDLDASCWFASNVEYNATSEDCEMDMDLVMKIFMEANKPKSKMSLDTSSN